MSRRRLESVVC